jgi:16S rRNA (guanine527-N7)-methyltransferase
VPKPAPYGPADFQFDSHVSRETLRRLAAFAELLERWNARINLVAASTIPDLWRRHMLDSAQLAAFIPAGAKTLLDLGAGAGFPGLVLSIMGAVPAVHLVESDQRKGIFLREAIRITGAPAILHPVRIEALDFGTADIITARALAPLGSLLAMSERFRAAGTVCLFPKGERLEEELTAARAQWHMDFEIAPSRADSRGKIIILKEVRRV